MPESQRPLPDAAADAAAPVPAPRPSPSPGPSPEAPTDGGERALRPVAGDGSGSSPVVSVMVTRSGGFAGVSRRWKAEAGETEADRWRTLIEGCPWDAAADLRTHAGADRFIWTLDARCGERSREAELAEADVQGPWRELINAVKEAAAPHRRGAQPA